jgi:hypothetical protein
VDRKLLTFYPLTSITQKARVLLRRSIFQRDDDKWFFSGVLYGYAYDWFYSVSQVDKYLRSQKSHKDAVIKVSLELDREYDHYYREVYGLQ